MAKSEGELLTTKPGAGFLTGASDTRSYSDEVVDVPYSDAVKRSLDVVGTTALLAVFGIPMLAIAGLIRLSGGPVLFRQWRVGRNGHEFPCYKFRTMVPNADEALRRLLDEDIEARAEWQRDQKLKQDPRITRYGHFLRRTSLDELPQLFNVLQGQMSLVGPRPVIRSELTRYGRYAGYYLSVKPGITGLWQVSGRNDLSYTRRVALDCFYVKKGNFLFDVGILLRTVRAVIQGFGAY